MSMYNNIQHFNAELSLKSLLTFMYAGLMGIQITQPKLFTIIIAQFLQSVWKEGVLLVSSWFLTTITLDVVIFSTSIA